MEGTLTGFVGNPAAGRGISAPLRHGQYVDRRRWQSTTSAGRIGAVRMELGLPPLPITRFEALLTSAAAVAFIIVSRFLSFGIHRLSSYVTATVDKRRRERLRLQTENSSTTSKKISDLEMIKKVHGEIGDLAGQKARENEEYKNNTEGLAKLRQKILESRLELSDAQEPTVKDQNTLMKEKKELLSRISDCEKALRESTQRLEELRAQDSELRKKVQALKSGKNALEKAVLSQSVPPAGSNYSDKKKKGE